MKAQEILNLLEPVSLDADISGLTEGVKRCLPHIREAMRGIDRLYQRQMHDRVPEMAEAIDSETPEGRAFHYLNGPYNTLDNHKPYLPDVPELSPGRNVYPPDLGEAEFDRYLEAHPDEREALASPYTTIRRDGERLTAVPYATFYAEDLAPVAAALRRAAEAADHDGLAMFLSTRADALEGKRDILESDADWVRLTDTPLEVVIGPFEVYEDTLKGWKAFYEAMLLVVDREACDSLKRIEEALPELAAAFPTPSGSRPAVGGMAPMIVAEELLTAGEGHAGILTSAFNLPNDAGVRGRVGWKQVMIRNVMEAKFNACTRRIAKRVLSAEDLAVTSFDAYFFHVLLHEISHGLGPAYRADGSRVSEACGKHYSAIEEAKADTGALMLLMKFHGRFGIPEMSRHTVGASYFSGLYRSIRFGLHEAHGKANVIQYAFMKEFGAIYLKDGKLGVDPEKLALGADRLLDELTGLQATGKTEDFEAFLSRYGRVPEELERAVADMEDLPIDILPVFPLEREDFLD